MSKQNFKIMRLKSVFIVGVISMFAWSCKTTSPVSATSRIEVKEMVTSPETTLVDVRIPKQFSEKTIDGAVNVPLATIEDNLDFFRKQKQIVLFCNSGKQATQALQILKKNGINNVESAVSVKNVEAIQNEKK